LARDTVEDTILDDNVVRIVEQYIAAS
jgi:hypothetical protein